MTRPSEDTALAAFEEAKDASCWSAGKALGIDGDALRGSGTGIERKG